MNTYDKGIRAYDGKKFWKPLRALVRRWIDRERELIALRNAVGMLAEARRGDAAEYEEMRELHMADASRFRWLTHDHPAGPVRDEVKRILAGVGVRGTVGIRTDIDASREMLTRSLMQNLDQPMAMPKQEAQSNG